MPHRGPIFGENGDICIGNNCNLSKFSNYCEIKSYNINNTKQICGSDRYFLVSDYEVFQVDAI